MSSLPTVLLLGDSIRMNYQPYAAEALCGRAEVVGPAENCQFSLYTLFALSEWIERFGVPDVIHWNNGLHDVGHNPARRPRQIPLDAYLANLRAILGRIREISVPVVWATTTPTHPERGFRDDAWSWRNEEIDAYNAAARALMEAEGVPINDLHAVVVADVDRYLSEDLLHLSEAGCAACAEAVGRRCLALSKCQAPSPRI